MRAPLLLALAAFVLGGCGAHAPTIAACLDAKGFLVEQSANVVRGSSAHGVNFTLTLYASAGAARRAGSDAASADTALVGDAVVEFAGNPAASPGRAPGRLSRAALAQIRLCVLHP